MAEPLPIGARATPRARLVPRLGVAAVVVLAVLPIVAVGIASTRLFVPDGHTLEIEMRATGGNVAQLYWSADYAFSGNDMATEPLHQRPGDFDRLRFPLPARPLELIRFDPINGAGEIVVRSMRVLARDGRVVRTIDPLVLSPLHEVTRVYPSEAGVKIETTPGATDPMLLMRASWLIGPSPWRWVQFVTPFALAWISIAVAILVLAGAAVILRDLRRGACGGREALWFAAVFLTVLWARAALLEAYPVPVPFWDQWDGEAATLYIPWWHDGLSWRQMFMLHNEHRIFFSRTLAMALLVTNGQWDPHVQILVNAALQSVAALVFGAGVWMAAGRRHLPLIAGTITLIFAAPFALENSLAGFQSAFYFLLLFSGLALWLMTAHPAASAAWWLGLACAFCAPFTVAGGVFVVAPIAVVMMLRTLTVPREWRTLAASLAALAAVAAVAYAGLPPPIPYHEALKATTAAAFGESLSHNLAFPWIETPAMGLIVWLPMAILIGSVIVRRFRTTALERLLCGLSAWVLLQAAAIAYSRGGDGLAPASRYLDLLSFAVLVNVMALAALRESVSGLRRIVATVALIAAAIGAAVGVGRLSQHMLETGASLRERWSKEHVRTVRGFLETGRIEDLLDKRGPQELPYHSAWLLANWLQHPYIQRILPAVVRPPLPLAARDSSSTFLETLSGARGEPWRVFDSYGPNRSKNQAAFESGPVACRDFRHLRFEIAGAANDGGLRLVVRDAAGRESAVSPAPGSRSGWTPAIVRCPDAPFTVIARDASPVSWFAFKPPSEIAWGSAMVNLMIQYTAALGFAAVALAALAIALEIQERVNARRAARAVTR